MCVQTQASRIVNDTLVRKDRKKHERQTKQGPWIVEDEDQYELQMTKLKT